MHVETGHIITREEYDALGDRDREVYRLVPDRLAPAAEAVRVRGESVYESALHSPLARFGKKALRDKTRRNKAARKARRQRRGR